MKLNRGNSARKGTLIRREGHRVAIVFHGYRCCGADMEPWARRFADEGFTVLVPDALAHGQSDGELLGMGWLERSDVLGWIDLVLQEDPEAEILLFGVSMGGATVMMAAGEELPEQVKCVVEDCGYTSVWEEFRGELKNQFHLPAFPLLYVASGLCKLRAGYFLGEASSLRQLEKASVPMLFIHGEEDHFVPYEMLDEVYEACASPVKKKLSVPGAGHADSVSREPELYWRSVLEFAGEHMCGTENRLPSV